MNIRLERRWENDQREGIYNYESQHSSTVVNIQI